MSGQNNRNLDWATPNVARRWLNEIPPPQSHSSREIGTSSRSPNGENLTPTHHGTEPQGYRSGTQSRTKEIQDEDCKMVDAPSVSSDNERERSFGDPRRNNWPSTRGQISSTVHDATLQTSSLFPTDPASKRLWDRVSAENDMSDVFGYPVDSENARFPNGKKPFENRQNRRGGAVGKGGSVRGGAPVRRGEHARGGSYDSGLFTPGGSSQSRGY